MAAASQQQALTFNLFRPGTWKNKLGAPGGGIVGGAARKPSSLGEENKLYFNKELNKWVERGKEAEAAKDIAPLAPPKQLAGAFPAPASRRAINQRYVLQSNLTVSGSNLPATNVNSLVPAAPLSQQSVDLLPSRPPLMPLAPSSQQNISHVAQQPIPLLPPPPSSKRGLPLELINALAQQHHHHIAQTPAQQPTGGEKENWGPFTASSPPVAVKGSHLPVVNELFDPFNLSANQASDSTRQTDQMEASTSQDSKPFLLGKALAQSFMSAATRLSGHEAEADQFEQLFEQTMHPGVLGKLDGPLPWELPDDQRLSDNFIKSCSGWNVRNPGLIYNRQDGTGKPAAQPAAAAAEPEAVADVVPVSDALTTAASIGQAVPAKEVLSLNSETLDMNDLPSYGPLGAYAIHTAPQEAPVVPVADEPEAEEPAGEEPPQTPQPSVAAAESRHVTPYLMSTGLSMGVVPAACSPMLDAVSPKQTVPPSAENSFACGPSAENSFFAAGTLSAENSFFAGGLSAETSVDFAQLLHPPPVVMPEQQQQHLEVVHEAVAVVADLQAAFEQEQHMQEAEIMCEQAQVVCELPVIMQQQQQEVAVAETEVHMQVAMEMPAVELQQQQVVMEAESVIEGQPVVECVPVMMEEQHAVADAVPVCVAAMEAAIVEEPVAASVPVVAVAEESVLSHIEVLAEVKESLLAEDTVVNAETISKFLALRSEVGQVLSLCKAEAVVAETPAEPVMQQQMEEVVAEQCPVTPEYHAAPQQQHQAVAVVLEAAEPAQVQVVEPEPAAAVMQQPEVSVPEAAPVVVQQAAAAQAAAQMDDDMTIAGAPRVDECDDLGPMWLLPPAPKADASAAAASTSPPKAKGLSRATVNMLQQAAADKKNAAASRPAGMQDTWKMYERKIALHKKQLDLTKSQLDHALQKLTDMQEEFDELLLCLGMESAKNKVLCDALREAGIDPEPLVAAVEAEWMSQQQ